MGWDAICTPSDSFKVASGFGSAEKIVDVIPLQIREIFSDGIDAVHMPSSQVTVASGATITANGGIGFGGAISFSSPGALTIQVDGLCTN